MNGYHAWLLDISGSQVQLELTGPHCVMPFELVTLLKDIRWKVRRSQLRPLEWHAAEVRRKLWVDLWNQWQGLVRSVDALLRRLGSKGLTAHVQLARELANAAAGAMGHLCSELEGQTHAKESAAQHLTIAFGVPGVLGCMSRQGLADPLRQTPTQIAKT